MADEESPTATPSKAHFRSIRHTSFVDSYYDIKEEGDDDQIELGSKGSDVSSLGASKQILDDQESHNHNAIEESNRSFNPFGDDIAKSKPVPGLNSSEDDLKIDTSVLRELEASSSRRTVKRSNTKSSQEDHNEEEAPKSPPDVPTRRKGSIERRMLLKAGLGMNAANERIQRRTMMERRTSPMVDDDDNLLTASRRNSTGSTLKHARNSSMESLASFSSAASVTSSGGVEVGNLTFVTDLEMLSIMYEENDSDDDSDGRPSYSSLPPSAILGKGATSMVRLAWRKTNQPDNRRGTMDTLESSPSMDEDEEKETKKVTDVHSFRNLYQPQGKKSRRSIVRVVSQPMNENGSQVSAKGDLVAVKLIQKSVLKQMKTMSKDAKNRVTVHSAFDNIEREIAMMKRLQHPNLVRLFEVIDSVESDKLYMVLEYVSLGEILSHQEGTDTYRRMRYKKKVKGLTKDGYFDEENAALYFVDIMHGLAYLHQHGICHRDLKPENILLGANGVAKISDFGVAHVFDSEKDEAIRDSLCLSVGSDFLDESERSTDHRYLSRRESDKAKEMQSQHDSGILSKTEGTWCFWSPEMCGKNSQFSGYSADMWAAGICLFIFTTGKVPFFSMAPLSLFEMIAKAEVPYDEHPNMSDGLKNLLQNMLTKNPAERAGVGFCLQHEFCQDARIKRVNELGKDFDRSDYDIVLSNEEVDTAFSVTKLTSMFENKKRGHVEGIKETNTDGEDEESSIPQTFKISNKPKKESVVKQRSRKILKQLSESAVGSTSRKADCVIQ